MCTPSNICIPRYVSLPLSIGKGYTTRPLPVMWYCTLKNMTVKSGSGLGTRLVYTTFQLKSKNTFHQKCATILKTGETVITFNGHF